MPTEDYTDFENFLNDKIKAHGLSLEKVSEQSGITLSHLEALSRGHYEQMPPAPYLRGYLMKLGSILDFDAEVWWQRFQAMGIVKKSGPEDRLPQNRFAKISKARYGLAIAAGILILGYLVFSLPRILGQPNLSIDYPRETVTRVKEQPVLIYGHLTNADTLTVSGEQVNVKADGSWEKEISLDPGKPTTVDIVAKKFLGRQVTETRQFIYEAPLNSSNISPGLSPSIPSSTSTTGQ